MSCANLQLNVTKNILNTFVIMIMNLKIKAKNVLFAKKWPFLPFFVLKNQETLIMRVGGLMGTLTTHTLPFVPGLFLFLESSRSPKGNGCCSTKEKDNHLILLQYTTNEIISVKLSLKLG